MARSVAATIRARVKRWQKKLLLQDWKISVVVGALDDGARADCDANPEYKEATIRLDPEKVAIEDLDGFVVHELLHCHTWRLEQIAEEWGQSESRYAFVRDVAETTVTDLERVVLSL